MNPSLSDFDYDLPADLIAQQPLAERSASRLLKLGSKGQLEDMQFSALLEELQPADLLVINNTKVIPARLYGNKSTGGAVEVLIERLVDDQLAHAHVKSSKSPKAGAILQIGGVEVQVQGRENDLFVLVSTSSAWQSLLEKHGHMPLPPYIDRADTPLDQDRYQTVYAAHPGAVAAPTAGLHFDAELLSKLKRKGIRQAAVTLHVGAGTFQPIRNDNLDDHVMHFERVAVEHDVCKEIADCKQRGGKVVAVGTTVVRSLEAAASDGELKPFSADTNLFIRPGYDFKVVDKLITNFHLPKSTLLMLVSAFSGTAEIKAAYAHAIRARYRFFSYGDAMLLSKKSL